VKYSIVKDSNLVQWLKEEGYGFIALRWRGREMPTNKGVDMSSEELKKAWEAAGEDQTQDQ
tara:strand:- start:4166 stop:4348 length:183 start_codon:yes stop_codon:yes gene_type:complete